MAKTIDKYVKTNLVENYATIRSQSYSSYNDGKAAGFSLCLYLSIGYDDAQSIENEAVKLADQWREEERELNGYYLTFGSRVRVVTCSWSPGVREIFTEDENGWRPSENQVRRVSNNEFRTLVENGIFEREVNEAENVGSGDNGQASSDVSF